MIEAELLCEELNSVKEAGQILTKIKGKNNVDVFEASM